MLLKSQSHGGFATVIAKWATSTLSTELSSHSNKLEHLSLEVDERVPGDEASSMDYLAVQSQSNLGVKTLQNLERVRLCVSAWPAALCRSKRSTLERGDTKGQWREPNDGGSSKETTPTCLMCSVPDLVITCRNPPCLSLLQTLPLSFEPSFLKFVKVVERAKVACCRFERTPHAVAL